MIAYTAPGKQSKHWSRNEITWEMLRDWAANPDDHKDTLGYILGELKGSERRAGEVVNRSALMLDADAAQPGFLDDVEMFFPNRAIIHSTFNSTPDNPRYRIIAPFDRPVNPTEFTLISDYFMDLLGEEFFDHTCREATRFMYRPATHDPAAYEWAEIDGPPIDVAAVLQQAAGRPVVEYEPPQAKASPFDIEGPVGDFCRAYTIDEAIEAFALPYKAAEGEGRWSLIGGTTEGGLHEIQPGVVYSHHGTDPAYGVACNVFDLVRIHQFGHMDENADEGTATKDLPSQSAMLDLATHDARVLAAEFSTDFATGDGEEGEDRSWVLGFIRDRKTRRPTDVVANRDLIRNNDVVFQLLSRDEMSGSIITTGDLPWRDVGPADDPTFDGPDRSNLRDRLEREYEMVLDRATIDDMVAMTAAGRPFHPVRDYLDSLEWDGVERLETCLPGVEHTPYTRMVARKCLVAAVARIYEPGVKWDHVLVLFGGQGLGKTTFVERMAKGWSAALGSIQAKDTLLTLQRNWIMVSDEGHSLRGSDANAMKEFLTRTTDSVRLPYEKETKTVPRHVVIWGTTNDQVFLKRQEGNRRYLIVHCLSSMDFEAFTPEHVDQIWAEAVHVYRKGEPLYLTAAEDALAAAEREEYTEETPIAGVIEGFLDRPVPFGWANMSAAEREFHAMTPSDVDGGELLNEVCSSQIWVECLGRRIGDAKDKDLQEINDALRSIPGWKADGTRMVPVYGRQQVFVRDRSVESDLFD